MGGTVCSCPQGIRARWPTDCAGSWPRRTLASGSANRRAGTSNHDTRSIAALAIQRAAYACAHRIVANSRAVNDRLRAELVPARKIAVISNGLAVEVFRRHVARPTPRRVVTVANLRPEKCHDVLIDAAAEVLRRFPDARFEFVGSGPELATLRERARICGVAHAVAFLGHREDVADRLADADIFVLPSRSEAFRGRRPSPSAPPDRHR